MNIRKNSWLLFVCSFLYCFFPFSGQANDVGESVQTITVVSDDNYPPYIFQASNGGIQGILVDEWKLWETKTGIKVNLIAMDWENAQEFLLNENADVIDTLFFTEERDEQYDFTNPYATIEVPIFFHKTLSGIVDIASLKGFTIGVKAGDACIEILRNHGITSLQEYNSYKAIVQAAVDGQIKVFSIDKPPAFYYLYKMNFENEFHYSFNLYTGEFHRAVKKGNTEILKLVEGGFALINKRELAGIEKKWIGEPFVRPAYLHYVLFACLIVGIFFFALILFNITLRRKVRSKTLELQNLINQLQLSEERFRIIFDQAAIGVTLCDARSGKYVNVNKKYCDILGYTIKEMKQISFQEITHPDDLQEDLKNMKLLLDGTIHKFTMKKRFFHKDGSIIWAKLTVSPMWKKGEEPNLHIGILEDITESKQAENALKKSEKRFQDLFDSIDDLIYTQDMEGCFISANPAMKKYFGYQMDEFIGRRAVDFMEEKFQADFNSQYLEIVKKQGYHEGIGCFNKKNGEKIYIEYKSSMVNIDDGEPYISGMGRDVTEKILSDKTVKQLQEQVAQSQKMESIGTLAGGIAHDFNNILFPIVGYTEILLEDLPEDSPFRGSINEIYTGALRATELVKQILTFSRQKNIEMKLMKIQHIIKEALKLIRSTIPATIKIKQNINVDCGVIKADPTQIHQIIMNLATNAYHAMEKKGGELIVSLKEIELGKLDLTDHVMQPGTYACLTIADTGKGMNKELIQKIFDPFFTTKGKGKGTGMGLSVVHGIVKNMGGAIQVYSELDKGSEFHVYLPVVESASEKQEIQTKKTIRGGIEKVLLVDDEKAILTMEKQMLERLGYQVTSHTSSIEALEVFRANSDKFDLVITDMAMPNMPGDKLSAELAKIRPDIPVLLCTGFSETLSEEKAMSMGIRGFLLKPIVMKDFLHKVREMLDDAKGSTQG